MRAILAKTSWKSRAKWLLGMGYWIQGFRGFPWTAVYFFMKDEMKVDPPTLQLLQSTIIIPMVLKPLYGIVSDTFYFRSQHRLPYIILGAILQSISWLILALFSSSHTPLVALGLLLMLGDLGASIVEVANEAIVAELGKQPQKNDQSVSVGELQSFVLMLSSFGGVLGNLLGGVAIDHLPAQKMFFIFGLITAFQFFFTLPFDEISINIPINASKHGIKKHLSELSTSFRNSGLIKALGWLAMSYVLVPTLTGSMFYYQTQALHIDPSLLGISKVVGQASLILWSFIYNKRLKSIPAKILVPSIHVIMAISMLSDIMFIKGFYRNMGLPDSIYVIFVSGLMEVIPIFKVLPFSVLVAQICPPGHEGSVMAIGASIIAFSLIVGGYFGVILASYTGITGQNFSGFSLAIMIQAGCTLIPIIWSSLIPDVKKTKNESLVGVDVEEEV